MTDLQPFDIADPLPTGFTALEASAGTGKTFSIAGMVTRYVADGYEIGRILVVTFTKAAASELRDRIRTNIEDALAAVTDSLAGTVSDLEDPVLAAVCSADRNELGRRRSRLERALSDFDTATISTIHSYAQNLLAEQGMSGNSNPDATLLEDTSIVLEQAVADVLTQRAIDGRPYVDPTWVTNGADEAMRRHYTELVPSRDEVEAKINDGSGNAKFKARCREVAELADVVDEVVQRANEIRRSRAVLGFDDLLVVARDLAVDPTSGLAATVQSQIDLALIDEFQDTDSVQWELVDALFGSKNFTLVGDPKQSIYRFRGADVNSYVRATAQAQVSTLTKNFRSDHRILSGIEALFDGATFGDDSIRFHPVECGKPDLGLLELNSADASGVEIRFCPDLSAKADVGRAQIANDVAATVVELLNGGTIPDDDDDSGGRRSVQPADIAILIKAHAVAPAVQRALRTAGVPAVVSKVGSVFHTEAALQLLTLLRAVAFPASDRRVRAATLSWFIDAPWDQLDGDTSTVSDLQAEMAEWGELLQAQGLNAFFERAWQSRNLAERLIRRGDGLRNLTDLNHIRELLEADGSANHIHRLVERLETLMSRKEDEEGESDAFARRTDSDDDAVQIMTIHVSKGLEFPIVLSLGLEASARANAPVSVEDPTRGRRVLLPPKTNWPDTSGVLERAKDELNGEFRRLIYVAATRARHLSVIYFGSAGGQAKKNKGELAQLLFGGPASESGTTAAQALSLRAAMSDGAFRALTIDPKRQPGSWQRPSRGSDPDLAVATLDRSFDRARRRWSFTSISASRAAGEYREVGATGLLADGAPQQGVVDEATPDGLTVDDSSAAGSALPLGSIAGGAAFGTLVHEVLEDINFAAPDLRAEVALRVGAAVEWSDWDTDSAELTDGLIAAIQTPLGALFDGRRLCDFEPNDVLDEMNFELPLAPSVSEGLRPTGLHIGQLIRKHLPSDHVLMGWADELVDGAINVALAGHLTGAIDGVFRVRAQGRPDRYVVVDYKTNRLGTYGEPLEIDDYTQSSMAAAMAHHDYALQALLYAVAVHRYLRWRLGEAYHPEQNLGGAAYLFVRGMIGQSTPVSDNAPNGVFSWVIPPALVVELSDLLHSGVSG